MEGFAFLVLVFTAAAIAERADIRQSADRHWHREAVRMCLNDTEMTRTEIHTAEAQLKKIQDDGVGDETTDILEKYKNFLACKLEKLELMKDSKLVMSKVMENIEKYKGKMAINMNNLIECLSALNEDNEMTREDRAMGARICMLTARESKHEINEI